MVRTRGCFWWVSTSREPDPSRAACGSEQQFLSGLVNTVLRANIVSLGAPDKSVAGLDSPSIKWPKMLNLLPFQWSRTQASTVSG